MKLYCIKFKDKKYCVKASDEYLAAKKLNKFLDANWDTVERSKNYVGVAPSIVGKAGIYTTKESIEEFKWKKASVYKTESGKLIILNDDKPEVKNVWSDNNSRYTEIGNITKTQDDGKKHTAYFYD